MSLGDFTVLFLYIHCKIFTKFEGLKPLRFKNRIHSWTQDFRTEDTDPHQKFLEPEH
jgi:hypothetical protein